MICVCFPKMIFAFLKSFNLLKKLKMDRVVELKQMLDISPDDTFLNYALALEWQKLGEITKTIEAFEKLIKKHETYLATYLQYGNILAEIGDTKKAIIIYNKGIEIATKQQNWKTKRELETALELL